MQGPNEFLYIGNLKKWDRISEMKEVDTPSLITVGMHDELPPSCALKMHNALPNSIIKVFKNSSHMPFYEEPDEYFKTLIDFNSINTFSFNINNHLLFL